MTKIQRGVATRDNSEIGQMFAPRAYSEVELTQFHNKIQRFWDAPREVNEVVMGRKIEGVAQKFRHEDLHVAFGAAIKVQHGTTHRYLYNQERYEVFTNLWRQYEDWRRKQDWIADQRALELARTAPEASLGTETGEVPF